MKKMREKSRSAMDCEQTLVPGIPDDVTMEDISSKLTWQACNALQAVSREWQRAICSRSVYNARVRTMSTEAFLVLWCRQTISTFILYSCKDGVRFQLPPIPVADPHVIKYMCLDGRLYVWVRANQDTPPCLELYVLDVAGDRKWTERQRTPLNLDVYNLGVLDGKIYNFTHSACRHRHVLDGSGTLDDHLLRHCKLSRRKSKRVPQILEYDPERDIWSVVTPDDISCEGILQQEAGPSEQLLIDKWYEPFFTEWRRRGQFDSAIPTAPDNGYRDAMATQVECSKVISFPHSDPNFCEESLFFMGGKLLKSTTHPNAVPHAVFGETLADVRMFDAPKNIWGEPWKYISSKFEPPGEEGYDIDVVSVTAVGNILWALAQFQIDNGSGVGRRLLRSTPLDNVEDGKIVKWVETSVVPRSEVGDVFAMWPIYV